MPSSLTILPGIRKLPNLHLSVAACLYAVLFFVHMCALQLFSVRTKLELTLVGVLLSTLILESALALPPYPVMYILSIATCPCKRWQVLRTEERLGESILSGLDGNYALGLQASQLPEF